MKIAVTHQAEARGTGVLTTKALRDVLAQVPDNAVVKVETGDSQRDGSWWHVLCTWHEE